MSRDSRLLPIRRVEAFSDGVYAIAITLLVLDLRLPKTDEPLTAVLAQRWPSFLGYLISFVFIGASWLFHVRLTRSLSESDETFIGLNLIKLLFVSFLPFTTSVLADHLADAGELPAAVLFGANLTLASVMNLVLPGYAARTADIVRPGEAVRLRQLLREQLPLVLLYGLATVVGAFSPTVSVVLYLALAALAYARPIVLQRRDTAGIDSQAKCGRHLRKT